MLPFPSPRALAHCLGAAFVLASVTPLAAQQPAATLQLTLKDAIDLALRQGSQAQAAAAGRDAAEFTNRAFRSGLLPQLSLSGTVPAYNRSIIQVVQPDGNTLFRPQDQMSTALTATLSQTLPFTGGDFFVSSSLARLSVSGQQDFLTWSSTPVSFGLRQPLFRPNTASWDRKVASVQVDLAERQYRESREDVALQTSGLFFDVFSARVTLDNAAANVAVNDTLYTINKGRLEIGRIGENDLLQSELALLRARTSLDGARLEHERALAALRVALQLPAGTPIALVVPTEIPTFDADTALAVAQALENRATVANVQLQDVQAERQVTEARLNNGFGGTLQASYGFNATASDASGAYRDLLEARRLTVSVDIPLWQWGAHGETVQAAKAQRERVRSTSQATLDQLALEARFAALQLSQARRNLALSATGDTVALKRFDVAYNRYVIGRIAIDNLYIAQTEKDQARRQYVEALRGYWDAYYRLRRVTLYDFEQHQPIQ